MSRLAVLLSLGVLVAAAPLAAQQAPAAGPPSPTATQAPLSAEGVLATGRSLSDPSDPRCRRENRKGGEIVVCADKDADEKERYPGHGDADQGTGVNDGLPRAPDVGGLPDCSRGCIGLGSPPPAAVLIDLDAIPEVPKGSDADKVAKGEMRAD